MGHSKTSQSVKILNLYLSTNTGKFNTNSHLLLLILKIPKMVPEIWQSKVWSLCSLKFTGVITHSQMVVTHKLHKIPTKLLLLLKVFSYTNSRFKEDKI